jgi:hypothetical protein
MRRVEAGLRGREDGLRDRKDDRLMGVGLISEEGVDRRGREDGFVGDMFREKGMKYSRERGECGRVENEGKNGCIAREGEDRNVMDK